MSGQCPLCSQLLKVKNPEVNELIVCSSCNQRLIVKEIKNKKIIFAEAPKIEEDWGE